MKKINVDFTLKATQRKGQTPRFEAIVILKDINANQKVYGKNFSNLELTPSKALDMGDYQLICNERGLGEQMQNTKGFRINDAKAECGIGTYAETGDKYYFVRCEFSESVVRTCYLSQSQIKNLKFVNLGFTFEETDEVESVEEKVDIKKKVKPIVEE